MKKISSAFGKIFHNIGSFFDKFLITPITRFILKITDFIRSSAKSFDHLAGRKSTLLIVSLILAFGTFIIIDQESSVMIDQYAEILYNQPVTAVYNEELYVVEGLPKDVDITLIGQRRHIFLAKQSPSKGVSVDLTGLKAGNHKVTLRYTQRLKSLDYKLDPSQVTVTIYEKVSETRSLTYDILHQDSLDKKLYIDDIELDRTDVIIKGAEYKLKKVASVRALVDVKNIPNPKAGKISLKDVPLVAYDNDGKIVDVEIVPKTVAANITITSPSKEVPVHIVPNGTLAFGKAIKTLESNVTSVTVYGDSKAIEELQQLDVEIDVNGLDRNKDFNVTIKKPKGVTELSVKTMIIKVAVDNSVTKEFANISVRSENLASGLSVQAATEADTQVTVIVTGSEDVISKLDPSDIIPYIDLEGYSVGEHNVAVKVRGNDLRLTYESKKREVRIVISQ